MSTYSEAAKLADDIAKDICKDEKAEKFISGAASGIVGATATAATGNPWVGVAAGSATSGLSRSHSKEVAEGVTGVVVAGAIGAASVILAPILLIGWLLSDD